MDEARNAVKAKLGEEAYNPAQVAMAFEELQEDIYRNTILTEQKRVDGRAPGDLRNISCDTGVLNRVHGSAVFNRGETQSLVIATLGTSKDAQELDGLTGGTKEKSFILHYNFPPYSTGETGRFIGPGPRNRPRCAAERSVLPILPAEDEFPYTIRVVSEIMSSNGSTSMASICGATLSSWMQVCQSWLRLQVSLAA